MLDEVDKFTFDELLQEKTKGDDDVERPLLQSLKAEHDQMHGIGGGR